MSLLWGIFLIEIDHYGSYIQDFILISALKKSEIKYVPKKDTKNLFSKNPKSFEKLLQGLTCSAVLFRNTNYEIGKNMFGIWSM
jgi:hypothetical protein